MIPRRSRSKMMFLKIVTASAAVLGASASHRFFDYECVRVCPDFEGACGLCKFEQLKVRKYYKAEWMKSGQEYEVPGYLYKIRPLEDLSKKEDIYHQQLAILIEELCAGKFVRNNRCAESNKFKSIIRYASNRYRVEPQIEYLVKSAHMEFLSRFQPIFRDLPPAEALCRLLADADKCGSFQTVHPKWFPSPQLYTYPTHEMSAMCYKMTRDSTCNKQSCREALLKLARFCGDNDHDTGITRTYGKHNLNALKKVAGVCLKKISRALASGSFLREYLCENLISKYSFKSKQFAKVINGRYEGQSVKLLDIIEGSTPDTHVWRVLLDDRSEAKIPQCFMVRIPIGPNGEEGGFKRKKYAKVWKLFYRHIEGKFVPLVTSKEMDKFARFHFEFECRKKQGATITEARVEKMLRGFIKRRCPRFQSQLNGELRPGLEDSRGVEVGDPKIQRMKLVFRSTNVKYPSQILDTIKTDDSEED